MARSDTVAAASLSLAFMHALAQASRLCIAHITVSLAAITAYAHPILITTGTAEVQTQTLILRLHISDHDVQHAGGDPTDLADYQAQARDLSRAISARSDHGELLTIAEPSGQPTLSQTEDTQTQWPFDLRITIPDKAAYLTLQLNREGRFTQPRQIHLAYDAPDPKDSRTLRLTTGSNTEVICVNPALAPRDPDSLAMGNERFSRIILIPSIKANQLTLTISAPLSMLQTWAAFPQAPTDAIDTGAASPWTDAAHDWFTNQLSAKSGPTSHTITAPRCEVVSVQGQQAQRDKPLTFASTQIRAQFTINLPEAPAPSDFILTWHGFNNAVQSIDLVIPGAALTRRELPRGSATIALSRSEAGEWIIVKPSPAAR